MPDALKNDAMDKPDHSGAAASGARPPLSADAPAARAYAKLCRVPSAFERNASRSECQSTSAP